MCCRVLFGFTFDTTLLQLATFMIFFTVMNYLVESRSQFAMLVFTGLNEFCMTMKEITDNTNNKDIGDMLRRLTLTVMLHRVGNDTVRCDER